MPEIPASPRAYFRITVGGVPTVQALGELDVQTSPAMERAVRGCDAAAGLVRLDLSGVTFLDAAAMGSIVRMSERLRARGCEFRIAGADPRFARLLAIGGLTHLVDGPLRVPGPVGRAA